MSPLREGEEAKMGVFTALGNARNLGPFYIKS